MDDLLRDTKGAGIKLGGSDEPISPRTMERMRQDGTGPVFIRIGRLIRYQDSDLEAWLVQRRRTSTSDPDIANAAVQPRPLIRTSGQEPKSRASWRATKRRRRRRSSTTHPDGTGSNARSDGDRRP